MFARSSNSHKLKFPMHSFRASRTPTNSWEDCRTAFSDQPRMAPAISPLILLSASITFWMGFTAGGWVEAGAPVVAGGGRGVPTFSNFDRSDHHIKHDREMHACLATTEFLPIFYVSRLKVTGRPTDRARLVVVTLFCMSKTR